MGTQGKSRGGGREGLDQRQHRRLGRSGELTGSRAASVGFLVCED